jgi:hypothetical protein
VFSVDLSITVDNALLGLYVDGKQVPMSKLPNAANWKKVDVVKIPARTRVIGVSARDKGVVAGILASISGKRDFVTDAKWKCTKKMPAIPSTWSELSYDDSEWPEATVAGNNPDKWHGTITSIDSKAKWIWTANYLPKPTIDSLVYCRVHLRTYIFRYVTMFKFDEIAE